jgi:hypothetical protein
MKYGKNDWEKLYIYRKKLFLGEKGEGSWVKQSQEK